MSSGPLLQATWPVRGGAAVQESTPEQVHILLMDQARCDLVFQHVGGGSAVTLLIFSSNTSKYPVFFSYFLFLFFVWHRRT